MNLLLLALAGILACHVHALAATPQAVTDLQIEVLDSTHAQLTWTPVSLDIQGQPLGCVAYDLFLGATPYFEPSPDTWLDSCRTPEYTHAMAGESGFYQVQVRDCTPPVAFQLITFPPGTFQMGEAGVAMPVHNVTLTGWFQLGNTEVTNAQYLEALNWAYSQGLVSVSGNYVRQYGQNLLQINGSWDYYQIHFDSNANRFVLHAGTEPFGPGSAYPQGYDPATLPAACLTWYGAACYCDWRSQMEGLPPYYHGDWSNQPANRNPFLSRGYRLPTEAEWEYAAQYADERIYPWGDAAPTCELANFGFYGEQCLTWARPVGHQPAGASALGLLDMAGNQWEWCNDYFGTYSASPATNPMGPVTGSDRILRGGSWNQDAGTLRCAARFSYTPSTPGTPSGFRVCRSVVPITPIEWVTVPAGIFSMGQASLSEPVHQVGLSRDFQLQRTEVTNAQYLEALNWALEQGFVEVSGDYVYQGWNALLHINEASNDRFEIRYDATLQAFVLRAGTYVFAGDGPGAAYPLGYFPENLPVQNLTWYGAAAYCDWRSLMEGLTPYYGANPDATPVPNNPYLATGYRLPTEAEWEYAAQFDDERFYPWGSASPTCTLVNGWPLGFSLCMLWSGPVGGHPAGASALGLQDMAGNGHEWINDWQGTYGGSFQLDPVGPDSGTLRGVRSSSYIDSDFFMACAKRSQSYPWIFGPGLRMCRTLPATEPAEFIAVPAGTFNMGSVDVNGPVHSVTLTHDFLLGRQEVSNAQYLEALNWALEQGLVSVRSTGAFRGDTLLLGTDSGNNDHEIVYDPGAGQYVLHTGTWVDGSYHHGPGQAYPEGYDPAHLPVQYVTWCGAAAYCDWRSQMEGLTPFYNYQWNSVPATRNPYTATGYRLPMEAEWERAARFNDGRTYAWGENAPSCDLANFGSPSAYCLAWSAPVDSRPAGASWLGFQNLSGNVTEWVNDWYGTHTSQAQTDPLGPVSGNWRATKGGDWGHPGNDLKAAAHSGMNEAYPNMFVGIRVCRTLP